MEPGPIRIRLSVMMFGQYLILGAWAVPLASYLLAPPARGGLGFSPAQTSWIYSSTAIAGLLAPLVLGLLINLFSAVYVSRTIFMWLLSRKGRRVESLSI